MKDTACSLPADLARELDERLSRWDAQAGSRRLWQRDASLWSGRDEGRWLGWLDIVEKQLADLGPLRSVAEDARSGGFRQVLLLGMGGSSLCPEVLRETFGTTSGYPELLVLDSTDPVQVRDVGGRADAATSLFVVASKSGSTLEPEILRAHFFEGARKAVGEEAGRRFIAITDPGSQLEKLALRDDYRRIVHGVPEIGGRFSALSNFGMVPAALAGFDFERLLHRARAMAERCSAEVPARENPGVLLGNLVGACAAKGRDKLTLVISPALHDLGAWLEQLVAESTGKQGRAVIPVDRERLGPPELYGSDRLFAYVRLDSNADAAQDDGVAALEKAGLPVVRIHVADVHELGAEFFRWEIATAVAGSVLGIHPFDQPDVEAAKVAARKVTAEYERTGALQAEAPLAEGGGLAVFTDERNASDLGWASGETATVDALLRAHLQRVRAGDYFALLAFVPMTARHEALLQTLRHRVRDRRRVATCLGFGPRFLHSTGQAYKGGPGSGVFLQVTCDDAQDLPVPGQKLSFGVVKAAQAKGDFAVLAERGRRALRVHVGPDVAAGLAALDAAVERALA
jgi:transaldolase/glucose-6-phosphate isomerase